MYRFMILKIYQKFVSGGDGAGYTNTYGQLVRRNDIHLPILCENHEHLYH